VRIGVIYPQTEYGNDPAAIRDYAQTAEDLGFTHLLAYDHILGENAAIPAQGYRPYTHLSAFQEPFVLFSYLAGLTRRLEFTTGILILPQRQTPVKNRLKYCASFGRNLWSLTGVNITPSPGQD